MFDFLLGSSGVVSLVVSLLSALLLLVVWFKVNRASVRANEQIRLLTEIAEQQRRQTELLTQLAGGSEARGPAAQEEEILQFKGFVPER
ncbi:hypothetical protein CYR55_01230 [Chimaeribacter californicus]|uniref:YebO family protein n=1 Tax=Chimaeribacter californicus TaxID=2060067 RepID=A0A2N5EG15_9GAMM|nr:YebO family protein [Chimaeribacter californicus]PLR41486.1 hypothetical protein CYR55_01230 [Chimaeribacter californicus]